MPLSSSSYPTPGGPFVEQATQAPGETRESKDDLIRRLERRIEALEAELARVRD